MSNTIKGITVEIGGNTAPLDKALKGVDQTSRNLQSELKKVEKLLKFDPKNTELLAQKQQLLTSAIKTTEDKLGTLRQAQEKMNKAHEANAEWEKQYAPLGKAIDETKSKMKQLAAQEEKIRQGFESGQISQQKYDQFQNKLNETTAESKRLQQAVKELDAQFVDGHISDEQYRDFNRQVQDCEISLNTYKEELATAEAATAGLSVTTEHAGTSLDLYSKKIELVSAQYDREIASIEKDADESQKLVAEKEKLTAKVELQKGKLSELEKQYESLTEAESKDEGAILDCQIALEKQSAEVVIAEARLAELQSGTVEITDATEKYNAQMEKLDAEHDRAVAFLDKNASATKRLTIEKNTLQQKLELQKAEVQRLKKEHDDLTNAEIKNEKAILDNATALERARKEAKETSNQLKDVTKDLANNTTALKEFGEKATGAGKKLMPASLAVAGLGAAAVSLASDYDESANKVEVAFGRQSNAVKEWSKTTLDSYGIASGSALEMASLFGDMATGMQLSQSKAADMSMSLVGLAGDLSSFKNVSLDVAQNALKGIFTGEGESLKSLGIIMTDTTLKEYALSQGIKKSYSEMSQAEKVQLRYQYVMETAKNAQGDFSSTADGTANSIRIMSESTKELGTTFGQMLLPIITPIIQKVTGAIKWINGLDEGSKKFIVTIGLFVAVSGPLLTMIGSISKGISAVGSAMSLLAANPIVLLIAAIAALVAGFIYLWNTSEEFQNFFISMGNEIASAFKAVGDFFVTLFTRTIPGALQKMRDFFSSIFKSLVDIAKKPINAIISLINGLIGGINFLIDGINSIQIKIPDWFPDWLGAGQTFNLGIPNIPEIPLLAKGGVLTEGQAIIAEANHPELLSMVNGRAVVQPLTGSNRNMPVAGTSNITNVTFAAGSVVIDPKDVRELNDLARIALNEKLSIQMGYVGG